MGVWRKRKGSRMWYPSVEIYSAIQHLDALESCRPRWLASKGRMRISGEFAPRRLANVHPIMEDASASPVGRCSETVM